MARDLFEHVIEEADAGADVRLAAAVEIQAQWMSVSLVVRRSLAFLMVVDSFRPRSPFQPDRGVRRSGAEIPQIRV